MQEKFTCKDYDVEYVAEIDKVTKDEWLDMLLRFSDATIYQTWAYGIAHWGERNISHLVLKKNGKVVSIAQLRIMKFPFVRGGIAYVGWGPLWRLKKQRDNLDNLSKMVRAIKQEYVGRRRLYLRVFPNYFVNDSHSNDISLIFTKEQFQMVPRDTRTLVLDLSPSMPDLRMNLNRKWRQALGYAQKVELTVVAGTDERLLEIGMSIYKEMHDRKHFAEFTDYEKLFAIQNNLPDFIKNRILLCYIDGEPVAALAWSAIGDVGLPLLAATGVKGREYQASYLLWWKMIEWLKENGYGFLDLGGINPERNPGNYLFKSRLAGKAGKDFTYLGQFDSCEYILSDIMFKFGCKIRQAYRGCQLLVEKHRRGTLNKDVNVHKNMQHNPNS